MNKLILFLSTPNRDQSEKTFNSDIGQFTGINSSDAPTKYILKYIDNNNSILDEIICIVTEQSKNNLENYKELLSKYCTENEISSPKITDILYSANTSETIKSITENIHKDDNIFIDTTGGFRDISYILLFIVRFLEYAGINFKKAIYGNYNDFSIIDVTSTYKLFNLINSADNFTSFGSSQALSQIFENTNNQYIKNLIQSMNDFSNAITLCRTKNIDDIFSRLNTNLNKLANNINTDNGYELLFYQMTDLIRQKFQLDNPSIDYVNIINWCLDNNLIQQAITIYTDKIPKYLHQKGYFDYSNNILENAKKKNQNNDIDYEIFYNGFLQMKSKDNYLEISNLPLKSLLSNHDVTLAFENSKSLDEFKKSKAIAYLKIDFNVPEIKNGVTNIIRLKSKMYMGDMRISQETVEKNLQHMPILLEISKDITANNVHGMIKQLKNNEKALINLQKNLKDIVSQPTDTNNIKPNERINVVENLDIFLNSNTNDFSVNVSTKKFQSILRDYLYIKNWLRNIINHAGDESSISDLDKQYYQKYGYSIDEELSVNDIQKTMKNALHKFNL